MISVAIRERGIYKLTFRLRAAEGLSSLAQIPMTVFKDKELAAQVTLNGSEREWKTEEIVLSPAMSTFFLKLYFAQAGMEIGGVEITLVESLEERIRAAIAAMQAGKDEE